MESAAPTMTAKPTKRRLRLGSLFVGLILLVNPSINLFDLMPDFIGYALILYAIAPAADSAAYFSDAYERFLKLFWIGASKYPALLVMMMIYAGDMSQRSIIAVFALVYAVIELLYLLPAFRLLFEGFFYLGERHDCMAAISRDGRIVPERLPYLAAVFFSVRAACSCLPELALVPYGEEGETQRLATLCLRAYPLLAVLGVLTVIVFAFLFMRPMRAYLNRLSRDGKAEATVRYLEAERRLELTRRRDYRSIRAATVWLIIGAGLGIDLIFDSINYVPDALAGLAFTAALIILGKRIPHLRLGIVITALYSAVSFVSYTLSSSFYTRYSITELYERGDEARTLYSLYLKTALAELILSAALAAFLSYALLRMIPLASDSFGEADSMQSRRLRRSMRMETVIVGILHFLSCAATYASAILAQYTKTIHLESGIGSSIAPPATSATVPLIDGFWLVPLLLSVAHLLSVLHLTGRFRTESEITYADLL